METANGGRRRISLAAGTVLDVPAVAAVELAAAAGYDAVGLRFTPPGPTDDEVTVVRRVLDDTGLAVLDVEYVRLTGLDDAVAWARRLAHIGVQLGARFLLTVVDDADRNRAAAHLAQLARQCAALDGPRPAVEAMPFSELATLDDAVVVLDAAEATSTRPPRAVLLVDALHVARADTDLRRLQAIDAALVPYVQLCDAPADPPTDGDLAHEARHARLLPGDGALDLAGLLAAVPAAADISVEVQSRFLTAHLAAPERARRALQATRSVLAQAASNTTG